MKHENGHTTEIVVGSHKQSEVGGVEYIIRCCGTHEASVHIQTPGKYSVEELDRLEEDHQHNVALAHANEVTALAYLSRKRDDDIVECEHCK